MALYKPASFFMLRTPALPVQKLLLQSDSTQLLNRFQDPEIQLAILTASPSLYTALKGISVERSEKKKRKAISSLLNYLIRMSTRPTPFSLLGGMALGEFGDKTSLTIEGSTYRSFITQTRVDMGYLLHIIKEIESSKNILPELDFYYNKLAYVAGDRIILPRMDVYGQAVQQSVSLRLTAATRAIIEITRVPLPYSILLQNLLDRFPQAQTQQIEQLIQQCWNYGLLISTLHPPQTHQEPARYLLQKLEPISSLQHFSNQIKEAIKHCDVLDDPIITSREKLEHITSFLQNSSSPQQNRLQIDSTIHISNALLSKKVGELAAWAGEVLLRLSSYPYGYPHMSEYRERFLEKYSLRAEVPLQKLLSPELGLGTPRGYTGSDIKNTNRYAPNQQQRYRMLQHITQKTLKRNTLEYVLSEHEIASLETWQPRSNNAPPSLEVSMQLNATSQTALNEGVFQAIISPHPGSDSVGKMFGRFFHLFESEEQKKLRNLLLEEEQLEADAIIAELSYQYDHARSQNISIRPMLRQFEIPVGTTPSLDQEYILDLDDLVVGVEHDRFYLRSSRLEKKVIPKQLHMHNSLHAPHVCRFLSEIASDSYPIFSSFDWGELATSIFLPRLIIPYNKDIHLALCPARWNLYSQDVFPQHESKQHLSDKQRLEYFYHWRDLWNVPRFFYVTHGDNRLLHDSENPIMVTELLRKLEQLSAGKSLLLEEMYPNFDHLWISNTQSEKYISEIVVPLLRNEQSIPAIKNEVDTNKERVVYSQQSPYQAIFYPGDQWSYVKLYCTHDQQNEIIAMSLVEFIQKLYKNDEIDHWFFIRYADPEPHLRIRLHAKDYKKSATVLTAVLSWARTLTEQARIRSFSVEPYERETHRYGGPEAIVVMEKIFSINSEVCLSLLAALHTHRLTLDPIVTALASIDSFFTTWGYTIERKLQWLNRYHGQGEMREYRKTYEAYRKTCSFLLNGGSGDTTNVLFPQMWLLTNILEASEKIIPLLTELRALPLMISEDELLASLAHMFKIRLLGVHRPDEQRLYVYWYYALKDLSMKVEM